MTLRLTRGRARLDSLTGELAQLSPLRVLDRGYAIVRDRDGHVIKDPAEVQPGTALHIRVAKGTVDAEVK